MPTHRLHVTQLIPEFSLHFTPSMFKSYRKLICSCAPSCIPGGSRNRISRWSRWPAKCASMQPSKRYKSRNIDYKKQEAPSASFPGSDFGTRQIREKSADFSGRRPKAGSRPLPRESKMKMLYRDPMKPDIEKLPYTNLIKRQIPHLLMPPTGSQAQVEQQPDFLEF